MNVGERKEFFMRQNKLIEKITASQLRDDIPDFRAGDTVRVHALINNIKIKQGGLFDVNNHSALFYYV